MRRVRYLSFVLIALIVVSVFVLVPQPSEAMGEWQGDHFVYGLASGEDSDLEVTLGSGYWLPDVELYVGTVIEPAQYSVVLNNERVETGTVDPGPPTRIDLDLDVGTRNTIRVHIEGYEFEYSGLVSPTGTEEWVGPAPEPEVKEFSVGEWNRQRYQLVGFTFAICFVAAYVRGKAIEKNEKNKEEVVL